VSYKSLSTYTAEGDRPGQEWYMCNSGKIHHVGPIWRRILKDYVIDCGVPSSSLSKSGYEPNKDQYLLVYREGARIGDPVSRFARYPVTAAIVRRDRR